MRPAKKWRWDRIVPWLFIVGMGAFIAFSFFFMVVRTLVFAF